MRLSFSILSVVLVAGVASAVAAPRDLRVVDAPDRRDDPRQHSARPGTARQRLWHMHLGIARDHHAGQGVVVVVFLVRQPGLADHGADVAALIHCLLSIILVAKHFTWSKLF